MKDQTIKLLFVSLLGILSAIFTSSTFALTSNRATSSEFSIESTNTEVVVAREYLKTNNGRYPAVSYSAEIRGTSTVFYPYTWFKMNTRADEIHVARNGDFSDMGNMQYGGGSNPTPAEMIGLNEAYIFYSLGSKIYRVPIRELNYGGGNNKMLQDKTLLYSFIESPRDNRREFIDQHTVGGPILGGVFATVAGDSLLTPTIAYKSEDRTIRFIGQNGEVGLTREGEYGRESQLANHNGLFVNMGFIEDSDYGYNFYVINNSSLYLLNVDFTDGTFSGKKIALSDSTYEGGLGYGDISSNLLHHKALFDSKNNILFYIEKQGSSSELKALFVDVLLDKVYRLPYLSANNIGYSFYTAEDEMYDRLDHWHSQSANGVDMPFHAVSITKDLKEDSLNMNIGYYINYAKIGGYHDLYDKDISSDYVETTLQVIATMDYSFNTPPIGMLAGDGVSQKEEEDSGGVSGFVQKQYDHVGEIFVQGTPSRFVQGLSLYSGDNPGTPPPSPITLFNAGSEQVEDEYINNKLDEINDCFKETYDTHLTNIDNAIGTFQDTRTNTTSESKKSTYTKAIFKMQTMRDIFIRKYQYILQ